MKEEELLVALLQTELITKSQGKLKPTDTATGWWLALVFSSFLKPLIICRMAMLL